MTQPLRIIRSTDAIAVEHPIITLFGQPGICKTSLGEGRRGPEESSLRIPGHCTSGAVGDQRRTT